MGRFYPKHDLIEVPENISQHAAFGKKVEDAYKGKLGEIENDLERLFRSGNKYTVRQNHFSILNRPIDQEQLNQAYLNAFVTLDHFSHKLRSRDIDKQLSTIKTFGSYLEKRLERFDLNTYKIKLEWYYVLNTTIDNNKVESAIKTPLVKFLKTQKTLIDPKVEEVKFNFINARRRLYEMNTKQIELLKNSFYINKFAIINIIRCDIHPSDFSPFIVISIEENDLRLTLKILNPLDKNDLRIWEILKPKKQYLNLTRQELLKLKGFAIIDYSPELPPLKSAQKFFRQLGFHHIAWGISRLFFNFK